MAIQCTQTLWKVDTIDIRLSVNVRQKNTFLFPELLGSPVFKVLLGGTKRMTVYSGIEHVGARDLYKLWKLGIEDLLFW